MARTFVNVSTHRVTLAVGGAVNYKAAGTAFAVIRLASDVSADHYTVFSTGNGGTQVAVLRMNTGGGAIALGTGAASVSGSVTVTAADGWVFIAASKATGTTTPRMHKYVYTTDTWTRANASTTLLDSAGTADAGYIGSSPVGVNRHMNGDIAAVGVTLRVLSDDEVSSLPFSLAAWHATAPIGMWLLDQSATSQTIIDLTGGGANQSGITGTSVSTDSVPILGYGDDPVFVNDFDGGAPPPAAGPVFPRRPLRGLIVRGRR